MKLVTTPVPDFNGKVGQVTFVEGIAKVADDAQELGYFRSAGYGIADFDKAVQAVEDSDDPETVEELENLGEQGGTTEPDPLVVTEHDDEIVVLPRKSASTDVWRAFAVQQGMSEDEADAKSRDELVDHFTDNTDEEGDR